MAKTENLIFVMTKEMKQALVAESQATGKSQAEIVRDAVTARYASRIIAVQHADGRVEIDPEAK